MSVNKVVLYVCACYLLFGSTFGEILEISDGKIEGTLMTSRLGLDFHAFLRIPYAAPPIDELRFEAPRQVERWSNTLNCTKYGPMCMQNSASGEISEDCLHLNVYTKTFIGSKPVIVFFHGGAFEAGSAINQGPHNMMDRDVVLVTVNYRLGPLGFLSTGTKESPGNAGLKDQVLALKWIQKNIAKFGGDNKKVTIAGFSAGAYSVSTHMVSKMANGLFHNVIAVSGSPFRPQPLRQDYLDEAKMISKALNCTTEAIGDMMECLKKADALAMVNVVLKKHPECQIIIWRAVIEPDFGQERYLADDPVEIFKSGNFSTVPIMIGRTNEEFIDVVPRLLNNEAGIKQLNENFDEMAPFCFYYEGNTNKSRISKAIRDAYLPFDTIDIRSFNALTNLFGDAYVGYGIHQLIHLISNFTDVFYYKFTYVSRFSSFYYPKDLPYGVQHGDDMQYPLYTGLSPVIQTSDPEHFMIERMTRIWEHFAYTGSPNYDSKVINWPKYDLENEYYMEIGTHLVEKHGLFLERYSTWDKVPTSSCSSFEVHQIFLIVFVTTLAWIKFH